MKYEILKTGSKGNCIIVEDKFMLDCGVPYKVVEPYLKDIKLIFISHIHGDHLNKTTVEKIAYNYPNIKFVCGVEVNDSIVNYGVVQKNVYGLFCDIWYCLGMCNVKVNYLYHDVPNYALSLFYKNKTLFYATDTSKIDHIVAKDYDTYLIEANYYTNDELDEKILEAQEKGEFTYLNRVKQTHLSQLDAINWLDKNKGENSHFMFIHEHISKEVDNND